MSKLACDFEHLIPKRRNCGAKRPNFSMYYTNVNLINHYQQIYDRYYTFEQTSFTVDKIRVTINFYKLHKLTKKMTLL